MRTPKVEANKKAVDEVSTWAGAVEYTLVNATPVLKEADDVKGSIGKLLDAVVRPLQELLVMMKSYQNRHYIVKLFSSKAFKRRFDDAKKISTELLQVWCGALLAAHADLTYDRSYCLRHITFYTLPSYSLPNLLYLPAGCPPCSLCSCSAPAPRALHRRCS